MHASRSAILALVAVSGCAVEHHVVVNTIELHKHLPELRAKGQVEVDAVELREKDWSTSHRRREIIRLGDGLGVGEARFPVSEIVHGCPDAPPPKDTPSAEGDCPLITFGNTDLEIRSYTRHSVRTAGGY